MKVELVEIGRVVPYARNPRRNEHAIVVLMWCISRRYADTREWIRPMPMVDANGAYTNQILAIVQHWKGEFEKRAA